MGITGDSTSPRTRLVKLVGRAIQARHPPGHRPLAVLVEGTHIDLDLLLLKVRHFGGYSKTSGARNWGNVAISLGLPPYCGPSVKLVYLKYLKNLETGRVLAAAAADHAGDEDQNVDLESTQPQCTVPEALCYVKRLALDPENASLEDERGSAAKRVLSGFRLKDEEQELLTGNERRARRGSSAARYSLRSFRPPLKDGLPLSPSAKKLSVPIGPEFQAAVPLAAGTWVDESSVLFLGRVVWTPKGKVARIDHGSGECFEEGIVEQRIKDQSRKLELELGGELFREWGFDKMGEKLVEAANWSGEEQVGFAFVVKECRGEKEEELWPELQARFAGRRSRGDLVSYFFNVFLLRRRALQNRIQGLDAGNFNSDVDEDDDHGNFGPGAGSGSKAVESIFQNAEAVVKRCEVSIPSGGASIECSC